MNAALGFLFAVCADVKIKLVRVGGGSTFVFFKQVKRLAAHKGGHGAVADKHPAADYHPGIHLTYALKLYKPVFVDVCDYKSGFVHAGAEHNPLLSAVCAALFGKNVAYAVNESFAVRNFCKFGKNCAAHGAFVAGRPVRKGKRPEIFDKCHYSAPPSITYAAISLPVF